MKAFNLNQILNFIRGINFSSSQVGQNVSLATTSVDYSPNNKKKNKINNKYLLWFLTSSIFLFFNDGYLASFSDFINDFHTNSNSFQCSITVFLMGLGLSQLVYGLIYDIFATKKKLLIIGYVILLLGTIISFFSNCIYMFFLGRFLQGIGLGASVVLRFAILVDKFEKNKFSRTISYMNIVFAVLQPIIVLLWVGTSVLCGWRFNFLFLSLAIIIFLMALFFYEEIPNASKKKREIFAKFKNLYSHFAELRFLLSLTNVILIKSIIFFCMFISPTLFQGVFKLSAIKYSFFNLINISTMLIAATLNVFFVRIYGVRSLLIIGILLTILGSVVILLFSYLNIFSLISTLVPFLCIIMGGKIAYNNAVVLLYEGFFKGMGVITSVYTGLELLICSLLSVFMIILGVEKIQSFLGVLFFSLSCLILLLLFCNMNLLGKNKKGKF